MRTWKEWLGALVLGVGLTGALAQVNTAERVGAGEQVGETNETREAVEIEGPETTGKNTLSGRHGRSSRGSGAPVVAFFQNVVIRSNETVEVAVVICGNLTVQGTVEEAAVAIAGDVTTVGAKIGDAVVAVLGSVDIGPGSEVDGDVVAVGGNVDVHETARVDGDVQPVRMQIPYVTQLRDWVYHCAFKLRPLSLQVGWVWMVFGAFFLLYLLVAVALPRPVQVCVDEITRRPATTFFMAILTKLLLPIIVVVLAATGVGVVVIPFLLAALFFAALVGKVAFLEYLGSALGKLFGAGNVKPALALVVGTVMLAVLYLVPILGLVVFGITGLWGLGAAVTASFGSLRRETDRPPNGGARANPASSTISPLAAPQGAASPMTAAAAPMGAASPMSAAGVDPGLGAAAPAADPMAGAGVGAGFFAGTASLPTPDPTMPCEAYTLPRASFWERMGAGLLDLVLVGALCGLVGGPPYGFLLVLAYFSGMWAWKGTTVGGIVANLKVVRLDDRPVTITVALVRGLGAALSAVVFFLGFFWIFMDRERQAWHDKIAGTVVVRVPWGRSLV